MMNRAFPLLSSVFLLPALSLADTKPIDFNRDVRPILSENCFACHGPDKETRDADLRLDLEEAAKADLGGYAAITPHDPENSEIWYRILSEDRDEVMPPPKSKKEMTKAEKLVIKRWIEEGAPYAKHWAYVAPQRSEVPEIQEPAFPLKNPIDAYVLAQLEEAGLQPSPEAKPNQLLRRLYLDLIGLPPSPEEVQAFTKAYAKDPESAYQGTIDKLFRSPRFGERWARPWLDLARYADSNGFQADQLRDSWAYRDWVIEALNANMPFDRFTIEQLAGDLLPKPTLDQKIATGFHRTVPCNVEAGVHPEENRVNQVVDRVNTTGTVWLGTTVGCAQCHDHKYDPVTMEDYYSLFAFFNNTPVEVRNPSGKGVSFDFYGPKMDLPLPPEMEQQRQALDQKLTKLNQESKRLLATLDRETWEQELAAAIQEEPAWEVLELVSFTGTGEESHEMMEDGSLLVTGEPSAKTTYRIQAKTTLQEFRAFRLETLTHESLPGKGPGRGDDQRPNFVLTELRLKDATGNQVGLFDANADFSQGGWHVSGAVDGDSKTGWGINPEFHKPHWATFKTTEPVDCGGGVVTFEVDHQYGGARSIGRLRLSALKGNPDGLDVPEDIVKIVSKEAKARSRKEKQALDSYFVSSNPELQELENEKAALQKELKNLQPPSTLVMVEEEERTTNIMMRGSYLSPGEEVDARTPKFLPPMDPGAPRDRLGLAQWLVDGKNPLVARVTVNRWWNELFGRAFVSTLEDFGSQSAPPTHPELLDWLALEFVDSGWDMQHVLRLIVTSSTYRQDSKVMPKLLEQDPNNELYARGPRFRMEAEMIRDHALAVSGLLSTKMGGEPIMPYQPPGLWRQTGRNEPKWVEETDEDRFRRGIYVVYRRAAPYPSFVNFDASDRGACLVSRGRTNTPLQALTLLNDPAYVEMALALADRVLTEKPDADFHERIRHAYSLVLQREPIDVEREKLYEVFQERFQALDSKQATQLLAEPSKHVKPQFQGSELELATWFYVANILLNLDETISKS